jgi:peptide/nickel transport system permease protein
MQDFLLARLAALAGTILGVGLCLVVLLDLLPRGALLDAPAWLGATVALVTDIEPWRRLAITIPLVLLALLIASLGIGLGVIAGLTRLHWLDRSLGVIAAIVSAIPPFWLGLVLALAIGGLLRWLPASGFVPWSDPSGAFASLVLPALALGLPQAGATATATRALFETGRERIAPPALRREDRRSGLARLVVALPRLVGGSFLALLVGAVLVEGVFYLPGLGRMILGAAEQHDLAPLRSGLFVLAVAAAIGGLCLSLLRAVLDPDLRR